MAHSLRCIHQHHCARLMRQLNDVLDQMKKDGTIAEIVGKYLTDAERYVGDSDES